MLQKRAFALAIAGVFGGSLSVAGCGGSSPQKPTKGGSTGSEQFAIRGYYARDGKLSRVAYLPAEVTDEPAAAQIRSKSFKPPGIQTKTYKECQSTPANCSGGAASYVDFPIDEKGTPSTAFPGARLVQDIAETCEHPPDIPGARKYYKIPGFAAPWSSDSSAPVDWYVFNQKGAGCDGILQEQEIILCIADRLASVADAVDTVRFEANLKTLIFPPQELKDRFIARDMAVNALAHLATLDNELPSQWSSNIAASAQAAVAAQAAQAAAVAQVAQASAAVAAAQPNTPEAAVAQAALSAAQATAAAAAATVAAAQPSIALTSAPNCTAAYGAVYDNPTPVLLGTSANAPVYKAVFSDAMSFDDHIFSDHLHNATNNTADQVRDDIIFRAKLKAHILGAGGVLLRDLIDKSMQADLAGAETRRGQTGDPSQALRRMWGIEDDVVGPYDSLRHALRILFGRLEIAAQPAYVPNVTSTARYRSQYDAKCGGQFGALGVRALDLINGLGDGFSARWHDAAPNSAQQSLAMSTIGQLGLVVPPWALGLSNPAAIRAAVRKQLHMHNASLEGITLAAFEASEQKRLVDAVLDGIDDAALRFGLDRSFDAYRLLTDSSEGLTTFPITAPAGLKYLPSVEVASEVSAMGGAVVEGGLQRRDILVDAMGTLGAAQVASQCRVNGDASVPLLGSSSDPAVGRAAAVTAFQDVFLLGNSLSTSLAFLHDALAAGGSGASPDSKTERTGVLTSLDGSIASMRSWADKALVQESYTAPPDPDAVPAPVPPFETVKFRIAGLAPSDLAVQSVADMPSKIVVLWGESWQAECVAGIRSRCPSTGLGVLTPLSGSTATVASVSGERGTVLMLAYYNPAHPIDPTPLSNFRYYVVTPADPKGGQHGRILAALAPATASSQRVAGISDYQRNLANEIFGTGDQEQSGRRTCSNALTSALPRDYCLAGMQRDMFVPLSNELTSTGSTGEDSWRHYLTIAEDSAARADELGRQMIEKGEQQEIRREGGQEQLGTLCGTYVDVDSLHANPDGKTGGVLGSTLDGQINECTNPTTTDLVFLGEDPYKDIPSVFSSQKVIRDAYCTGNAPLPTFCPKDANDQRLINHTGLGLDAYAPPSGQPDCGKIVDAAQKLSTENDLKSIKQGLDALREAVKQGAGIDAATIGGGLGPLRYEVGAPGSVRDVIDTQDHYYWSVKRNKDLWLATSSTVAAVGTVQLKDKAAIFPACLSLNSNDLKTATPPLCADAPTGAPDITKNPDASILPDCSSPCIGDARQLARAFGATTDTNTMMYDVEAALWYAGAMAGRVPSGLFNVRVPARNLPTPATQVDAAELYSAGRFVHNNSDDTYRLYSDNTALQPETTGEESRAAGKFIDPLVAYWNKRLNDRTGRGFVIPPWREDIYSNASLTAAQQGHLLSVPVANSSISFDDGISLDVQPAGAGTESGTIPRELIKEWVDAFANRVKGQLASGRCQDNGTLELAPLNANGALVGPELLKDTAYAAIKHPRNICVNGSAPVFFEDLDTKTLHARLYYRSEDLKVSDPDRFRTTPYKGWIALGDLIDPTGLTALNVFVDDHSPDYDGPSEFFPSPYDPSQLKGGVFSLASVAAEEEFNFGGTLLGNPGTKSIKDQCMTAAGTSPSIIPAACMQLNPVTATSMGAAVYLSGETSWIYPNWREEDFVSRAILAGRRLRPTVCSPGDRAELFINREPRTNCDAAQAVARGLALSCLGATQAQLEISDLPPKIQSASDLRLYEAWVSSVERTLSTVFNRVAFQNLPTSVVDRFQRRDFVSNLGGGKSGTELYTLANHLEALNRAWHTVGNGFFELRTAISTARTQLESVDQKSQERELALAQQSLELSRQAAMSQLDQAISSLKLGATLLPSSVGFSGNLGTNTGIGVSVSYSPEAHAVAEIELYASKRRGDITDTFDSNSEKIIAQLGALGKDETMNSKDQVLDEFNRSAHHALDAVDEGTGAVRTSGNDILSSRTSIAQVASAGQWELGQLMGADFVTEGDSALPLHVNTVLNRQFNILKIRYEKALDQAKRAAYLARLSIEQKLGVRFGDLNQEIGPLPPPSGWIDDLCTLQGIDYSKLRCVGGIDPQTKQCLGFASGVATPMPSTLDDRSSPQIQNFANQYVGDYVARLKELVEFYNVKFPFKEADDVAVLSLRDNLLAPNAACHGESTNLLYHSDDLQVTGIVTDKYDSMNGWRSARCDKSGCMSVRDGAATRNPDPTNAGADLSLPGNGLELRPPDNYGGVSWLDYSPGSSVVPGVAPASVDPAPQGSVYQSVTLTSGRTYLVSWWDMARNTDGSAFPSGGAVPFYQVVVYNQAWAPVGSTALEATDSGVDGKTWSPRHSIEFVCPEDGVYHLVFLPADPSTSMSLAVANVQLEELSKSLTGPSSYVHTEGRRQIASESCGSLSKTDLLKAFTRRCEGGVTDGKAPSCYYELNRNIVVDSESHNNGFGGLVGQIGVGNFNLRHVDLSVNLVGTGLLDCSGSRASSCNASAFVEYDLEHLAYNAAIQNQRNQTACFNFGDAGIRSGKALAAERVLTLPLSGTDKQLIEDPAFTKTELAGRPISGVYRLRLRDNPALVFDRLDDIQLKLRYRYWSNVTPTSN